MNLTDGLDGLVGRMHSGIVSFTFLILALIQGYRLGAGFLADYLFLPQNSRQSAEMAVIAGSMVGACVGFLWFNCSPASVFMGDTGSLGAQDCSGYIAIVIRQEMLLIICGGIIVAEAMSVILQVGYFKYTRRRYGEGRRIFLMSPLPSPFSEKEGGRKRKWW